MQTKIRKTETARQVCFDLELEDQPHGEYHRPYGNGEPVALPRRSWGDSTPGLESGPSARSGPGNRVGLALPCFRSAAREPRLATIGGGSADPDQGSHPQSPQGRRAIQAGGVGPSGSGFSDCRFGDAAVRGRQATGQALAEIAAASSRWPQSCRPSMHRCWCSGGRALDPPARARRFHLRPSTS